MIELFTSFDLPGVHNVTGLMSWQLNNLHVAGMQQIITTVRFIQLWLVLLNELLTGNVPLDDSLRSFVVVIAV